MTPQVSLSSGRNCQTAAGLRVQTPGRVRVAVHLKTDPEMPGSTDQNRESKPEPEEGRHEGPVFPHLAVRPPATDLSLRRRGA